MHKFKEIESTGYRVSSVRSDEYIAAVSDSESEDRESLIRRRSHSLGLSYGYVWRILH